MKTNFKFLFVCLSLLSLIIVGFMLNKKHERFENNTDIYAIHSVFISKENILFMEEWIDYHIQLGFNKFYLYDNSKVTKKSNFDSKNMKLKPGTVNKYNINYDKIIKLNQNQVNEIMDKIVIKYKGFVDIIEWSPKDKHGNVLYNQTEAHNHCLKRMKVDKVNWCASIDMDEFIVLNKNEHSTIKEYLASLNNKISNVQLDQVIYQSRFTKLKGNIIDINKAIKVNGVFSNNYGSPKNIFKVSNTRKLNVHDWFGSGNIIRGKRSDIHFNHYKINPNDKEKKLFDKMLVNKNIKNHIRINSKKYIKHQY